MLSMRTNWIVLTAMMMGIALLSPTPGEAATTTIPLKLTYSLNGQDFTSGVPTAPRGGKVWVKASWDGFARPDGSRQPYLSTLTSKEDFASANGGRQNWGPGHTPIYVQRVGPGYVSANAPSITYVLDLGARKADVKGHRNQWSKDQHKFIDGPLGAMDALSPGDHTFTIKVYYRAKSGGPEAGAGVETFTIPVSDKPGPTPAAATNEPEPAAQPAANSESTGSAAKAPTVDRLFVSTHGSDANDGSQAHPLATLAKALSKAGPGDVITLMPGVYREGEITIHHGGEKGLPLTIQGLPGSQTAIKGSKLVKGWKPSAGKPGMWQVDHWPVDSQQLFADGKPLQQIGIHNKWQEIGNMGGYHNRAMLPAVGKDVNDVKPGTFFYDVKSKTMYCMLPDKSDPNGHMMEASVKDFILAAGDDGSYITLRNLTFMHSTGTAHGKATGLIHTGPEGWTIEHCTITYGDFSGIAMSGNNHTVRDCQITYNGDTGISMNGSDAAHGYHRYTDRESMHTLIEHCNISYNDYRGFYGAWHAGGLKLVPSVRGVTIRHCVIVNNNHSPGVWFDGCLGGNIVEDNYIAGNSQGIFYEISQPTQGDKFGVLIRNNVVANNSSQGIYISASDGAIVKNNTCYQNRWGVVVHGMPRGTFGGRKLMHNRVLNNILDNVREFDVVIFTGKDSADNVLQGNFYAVLGKKRTPKIATTTSHSYGGGVTYTNLAKLAKETDFGTNAAAGDPQWVDPMNGDFRLKPGSPAIGAGSLGTLLTKSP